MFECVSVKKCELVKNHLYFYKAAQFIDCMQMFLMGLCKIKCALKSQE